MNYIIEPSFFYWLSVAEAVKTLFGVIAGLCGAGGIVVGSLYFMSSADFGKEARDTKIFHKMFTVLLSLVLISIPIAIFVPSKETLIEMKIAQYATYENIDTAQSKVKEVIDYIFEKANEGKE